MSTDAQNRSGLKSDLVPKATTKRHAADYGQIIAIIIVRTSMWYWRTTLGIFTSHTASYLRIHTIYPWKQHRFSTCFILLFVSFYFCLSPLRCCREISIVFKIGVYDKCFDKTLCCNNKLTTFLNTIIYIIINWLFFNIKQIFYCELFFLQNLMHQSILWKIQPTNVKIAFVKTSQ